MACAIGARGEIPSYTRPPAHAPSADASPRGIWWRPLAAWAKIALAAALAIEITSWASLQVLSIAGIEYRALGSLLGAEQRRSIEDFIALQSLFYQQHDPLLGWTNRRDGKYLGYTQNHAALRSRRAYAAQPPPGTLRIAAFGDSFVHGDEVGDSDVWTARMEARRSNLEVLNFGVSGYGVDQALLRYERDGKAFQPHVVLIGFFPDDLSRNVNVFRPFLAPGTGHQMTKPRFVLEHGELRLRSNPLPRVDDYRRLLDDPEDTLDSTAPHDEYFPQGYRSGPLDVLALTRLTKLAVDQLMHESHLPQLTGDGVFERRAEAYSVTLALLHRFVASAEREQSHALVALIPGYADLQRRRAGLVTSYAPLAEDLRTRGYWVLDLADAFDRWTAMPLTELFNEVHYSALGNQIIADALLRAVDPLILAARG